MLGGAGVGLGDKRPFWFKIKRCGATTAGDRIARQPGTAPGPQGEGVVDGRRRGAREIAAREVLLEEAVDFVSEGGRVAGGLVDEREGPCGDAGTGLAAFNEKRKPNW